MRRSTDFPMVPRSVAKLRLGDYCLLMRADHLAVPLVFLCPQRRGSRSYFFGSIGNVLLSPENEFRLPASITLGSTALLHVECFERNGTPIVGNLEAALSPVQVDALIEQCHETGVGATTQVWGYRTPYKYAEALDS